MMKIAYLGCGTWGVALASVLASKGHRVVCWSSNETLVKQLSQTHTHPNLKGALLNSSLEYTQNLEECIQGAHLVIESVTAQGIRPVFNQLKKLNPSLIPIVVTSKGIEQKTGLLLPEVVLDVLGEQFRPYIGCLTGPSHAEEVAHQKPTAVVSSSFEDTVRFLIADLFTTPWFRVYPNADIYGVCFGGAMKNIIAIACGISDGLGLGDNTKAALMTRGLHEIKKLSVVKKCFPETLNGLSGMGDLCVTCLSTLSRNYNFGRLLAQGKTGEEAQKQIQMVVEGVYSCVSCVELAKNYGIQVPIAQSIYDIIYQGWNPKEAVKALMNREVKEEHL